MGWSSESTGRVAMGANPTGQALMLGSLGLLGLGVVMVHSATASVVSSGNWYARVDVRHTIFALAAALVLCAGWVVDYRWLLGKRRFGRIGLGEPDRFPVIPACLLAAALVCGVLVFVSGVGYAAGGRARWIRFGPARYAIGFQPSELIKLSLVIFLAAWLSRPGTDRRSFHKTFLPAVALIGVCAVLVVTQDFGTAVLICISAAAVLMLAGVRWCHLASLGAAGLGAGSLFVLLSPFRMARIMALLDPWSTTNPSAYQPRQSLLSILTGGYLGKGLGSGMIKRGFLPEGATDFIFATFAEECGLAGAMLLLGVVLIWIWQARKAASGAEDQFGRLLCGSLGFMIAFQILLHVAVDVVVAPPTGIGLPFVSAGGTGLLTSAAAAALIISVTARRRT